MYHCYQVYYRTWTTVWVCVASWGLIGFPVLSTVNIQLASFSQGTGVMGGERPDLGGTLKMSSNISCVIEPWWRGGRWGVVKRGQE